MEKNEAPSLFFLFPPQSKNLKSLLKKTNWGGLTCKQFIMIITDTIILKGRIFFKVKRHYNFLAKFVHESLSLS